MIRTGKPIAAMVWEMATVQATPSAWRPIYVHILLRDTVLSGCLGSTNRFSELRYQNLARIPLLSIEPHCYSVNANSNMQKEYAFTYPDNKKHTSEHGRRHGTQNSQ